MVKKHKKHIKAVVKKNEGLGVEIKTLIVVITLIFAYPVGLILMYLWMEWPAWIKVIITLPIFIGVAFLGMLAALFKL